MTIILKTKVKHDILEFYEMVIMYISYDLNHLTESHPRWNKGKVFFILDHIL